MTTDKLQAAPPEDLGKFDYVTRADPPQFKLGNNVYSHDQQGRYEISEIEVVIRHIIRPGGENNDSTEIHYYYSGKEIGGSGKALDRVNETRLVKVDDVKHPSAKTTVRTVR